LVNKGYDQARTIGPELILEKLGETSEGRPENKCVCSDPYVSKIDFGAVPVCLKMFGVSKIFNLSD